MNKPIHIGPGIAEMLKRQRRERMAVEQHARDTDPDCQPDPEVVELKEYIRKLRCEIRVLHLRLKDANRGAEREAHCCYTFVRRNNACEDKLRELGINPHDLYKL